MAWRNNTFSLHVHVGVQGADRAVLVCDRLRPVLPMLLAISANSPFLDGRDSGLHSARTQTFTKSFPRCGVPDAFGSWHAFGEYIDFLVNTGSIVEYTQVWWSVRPHFAFGTVEVRICDAQSTAAESEALAALIVACVAQAARDVDAGVPFQTSRDRLIEENVWRAVRYGLDGEMLDLGRGQPYPAGEALDRLLAWSRAGLFGAGDRRGAARTQRRPAPARDGRIGYRAAGDLRYDGGTDPRHVRGSAGKSCGGDQMSTGEGDPSGPGQGQPTEEELRAAYEAEIRKVRVEHVLLEHVVTMVNLGMRRTGLAPGTESERDPAQVRVAIESIRALLPLLEQSAPEQIEPIREALSQLQLAYVRIGGQAPARPEDPSGPGPEAGSEGGPDRRIARRRGRSRPPSGARAATAAAGGGPPPPAGEPGPAQRSGRLWVPGQ